MFVGCSILAVSACKESTPPEQPPPLPGPTEDQVGLPDNYATQFTPFYVFDQFQNRQVRVVYANAAAVAGRPFARGSILVMETYRADTNAQGDPVVGADGRYVRGALTGIFVSRKEQWFGRRYQQNQTGEWEYASYHADKTANQVGDATVSCAICHLDAGLSRDWVYRANIYFSGAIDTIPKPPPGQPADKPFILNYTYVPGTITVPVGTTITWRNDDQVKHTVTAVDQTFTSGLVSQGASFSRRFSVAGTYNYFCAIHLRMKGTVVVQP
jgi:Cytochrome P460/Cupredoxin-like domain